MTTDTPLTIALLGDFSAGRCRRGPYRIDRDNWEEVLQRLRVELSLDLAGAPISLRFQEFDDFHPDHLYRTLPLFEALRQARRRPPQPPSAPAASGNLLDQIAGVDDPAPLAPPSTPPKDEWDALIHQIVAPHVVPKPGPAEQQHTAKVDAAISAALRAILHHPQFQALEAAWQSVWFLVRRLDNVNLYLIDLTKQALLADLPAVERLLLEESEGPWSLLAGNYTFEPNGPDLAALTRLAALARQAKAPFLAEISPKVTTLDNPQPWQAFRKHPDARYLGLAMPRFLLRLPYGPQTNSTEVPNFEEMPGLPDHNHYLWGNPAIALLALRNQGSPDLTGLPVHNYRKDGDPHMTPCAEVWLTERAAEQILDLGVMPLCSIRNRDAIRLPRWQTLEEAVSS